MLISVITVCRNNAATIRGTLESVLRQHRAVGEAIVVDGASTDGTLDLVRSLEPAFQGRLRWISESDAGLYDALNKGIRMASGEVVGVLHADDFYAGPDVLTKVAALFATTGAEAVYADVRFVDAGDTARTIRYISARRFRPWMMRFGFMPPHPTIFCRRELFERLGYYRTDYHIAADHELMIRFLWKAAIRTAYLPEAIIHMRPGGLSTRSLANRWLACRENVRACRENGIYANLPMQVMKYAVKVFEYRLPR